MPKITHEFPPRANQTCNAPTPIVLFVAFCSAYKLTTYPKQVAEAGRDCQPCLNSPKKQMHGKNLLSPALKSVFLLGFVLAAHGVTFDFRPTSAGGNVGEEFDGAPFAEVTVDGLTMQGAVVLPTQFGGIFNFTANSAPLGIGVRSHIPGDRATMVDVSEGVAFHFEQVVQVVSVTLQVFFLTADDGIGGPVSNEDDAIDITLGGETINVASPVTFSTGDSTTYTIDLSTLGFSTTFLDPETDDIQFAPTAGDGVRIQSLTVVPEPRASIALFSLGLCAFAGARWAMKRGSQKRTPGQI